MLSPFIRTGVQRRQMHAANAFGMHPEAARVLAMRGTDPELFAQRVSAVHGGTFEVGNLAGFTLGQPFVGRPPEAGAPAQGAVDPQTARLSADPRFGQFMRSLGNTPYTQVGPRFRETFGLDYGDTLVTQLLTQAALEWKNYDTIHTRVCPIQTEPLVSGQYYVFDRSGQRRVVDSRIGPNGQVREVSRRVSSQTFTTQPRSLSGRINRLTQNIAPTFNQMSSETEFVMGMHDREMERDVATALHTSLNYPSGNVITLGSSYQWNGGASADPVQDVLDLLLAIPAEVNHAVFSDLAWSAAQTNADLRAMLVGTWRENNGLVSPQNFAGFFGIANVLISKVLIEDASGNVSRCWSETDLWMGHVNPGRDMLTSTRRFRTVLPGAGGISVRTAFDPEGPMGSDKVWVTRMDSDPMFVGSDFAGVIKNVRRVS